MKRAIRTITKSIFSIFIISGLFQFLLIPGVLWNALSPIILLSTISLTYLWLKNGIDDYLKMCIMILTFIFFLEAGNKIFMGEGLSKPENVTEIKLMTYNLFFKNSDPNSSITVILNANPDVLIVQELTPKWAGIIEKKLGKSYPYKSIKPLRGTHGIGVYSKYRLSNVSFLNNASNKPYAHIVDLNISDNKVQLANTHLASPAIAVENKEKFIPLYYQNYQIRKEQLSQINKITDRSDDKYDCQLLVGDMNTTKYEPIFKKLKWNWVDSYESSGKGFGFNFPHSSRIRPILTLDYILTRGKVECVKSEVLKGGSSDHLAIMSTLKI